VTEQELCDLYYTQRKTMKEIGHIYGLTKERIRQKMEEYHLKRRSCGPTKGKLRFKNLEGYLAHIRGGGRESAASLRRYIKRYAPESLTHCSKCGGDPPLFVTLAKNPATCLGDIKFLCMSCWGKPRIKVSEKEQAEICEKYREGITGVELAKKYGVCDATLYKYLYQGGVKVKKRCKRLAIE